MTVLAFIFIPVNLACSVFGMNIQELNGSGRSIWVIAVTAVALTIFALLGWWLTNLVLWARRDWLSRKCEGISLVLRLGRIYRLDLQRKKWGFSTSRMLLGLLTDGRYGYERPYKSSERYV